MDGLPECGSGSTSSSCSGGGRFGGNNFPSRIYVTYDLCPDAGDCSSFTCGPLVAYSRGSCVQYEHVVDSTALFCDSPTVIDFDTDGMGNPLAAGTPVDSQWVNLGVTFEFDNARSGHPDLGIIFDSNNPTGGDLDLGTPNRDFGGPGRGTGGEAGEQGENADSLSNLLIIAEDAVDVNNDGLVDDPDDEEHGGDVIITFDQPTDLHFIRLIDLDRNNASIRITQDNGNVVTKQVTNLGNNSDQTCRLYVGSVTQVVVSVGGSGAIAEIGFCEDLSTSKLVSIPDDADNLSNFGRENQVMAFPNPFKEKITFELDLLSDDDVSIWIADMNGRTIRKIEMGELDKGIHEITWDGNDANDNPQSSGVYFARIIMGEEVKTIKIALQR